MAITTYNGYTKGVWQALLKLVQGVLIGIINVCSTPGSSVANMCKNIYVQQAMRNDVQVNTSVVCRKYNLILITLFAC